MRVSVTLACSLYTSCVQGPSSRHIASWAKARHPYFYGYIPWSEIGHAFYTCCGIERAVRVESRLMVDLLCICTHIYMHAVMYVCMYVCMYVLCMCV